MQILLIPASIDLASRLHIVLNLALEPYACLNFNFHIYSKVRSLRLIYILARYLQETCTNKLYMNLASFDLSIILHVNITHTCKYLASMLHKSCIAIRNLMWIFHCIIIRAPCDILARYLQETCKSLLYRLSILQWSFAIDLASITHVNINYLYLPKPSLQR